MVGILIIAHGSFGQSLSDCAKHVLGVLPPQFSTLSVNITDDPATLLQEATAKVIQLNQGDGVLVLSDMYGATPCNIVAKLLTPGVVEGVAGVNLSMLVRVLNYQHESLAVVVEKAISGGREGVVTFSRNDCNRFDSQ